LEFLWKKSGRKDRLNHQDTKGTKKDKEYFHRQDAKAPRTVKYIVSKPRLFFAFLGVLAPATRCGARGLAVNPSFAFLGALGVLVVQIRVLSERVTFP
jgi:hypothetical protein